MIIKKHSLWTYLEFDKETEKEQLKIEKLIKKGTGVRPDGYMYAPAYKRGVWDGYTHFYDEKEHKLPTGLMKDLLDILGMYQRNDPLQYELVDESPEAFLNPEDLPETIDVKDGGDITLRDYQYGSVKEAITNSIGILNLSTNAGKASTSAAIIKVLQPYLERGEKIAYIVPSKVIFHQAIDTMKENFGRAVGWMGDGKYEPREINVILMPTLVSKLKKPTKGLKLSGKDRVNQLFIEEVLPKVDGRKNLSFILSNFVKNYRATTKAREEIRDDLQYMLDNKYSDAKIQMAFNNERMRFNKLMKKKQGDKYEIWQQTMDLVEHTKVLVVDEGHHSKADTYYNTIMQFENAQYRFAMSGSVDKKDKLTWQRMRAIYEQEIYVVTNDEMIERGISAKPYVRLLNVRDDSNGELLGNRNYLEVYDKGLVHNETMNNYIAQFTNSFYKMDKKTLIIVNRLEHGEIIQEKLNALGVKSEFIHGETSTEDRQRALDAVRDGDLTVLIATGILDEGLNVKGGLDLLIMAGAGKSLRLILQRVGRVLRKHSDGTNMSVVLDFMLRNSELLFSHSQERVKIYEEQGFDIKELN